LGNRSAAKAWRRSEQQRLRNRAGRGIAKTSVRRAERAVASGDAQASAEEVRVAISALDRAAQKGALHTKNAARRKACLMKKYNPLLAATIAAKEEAAPARKRRSKKEEVTKKARPAKKKKE